MPVSVSCFASNSCSKNGAFVRFVFSPNLLHHCVFVELWELASISHQVPVGADLLKFRQCCSAGEGSSVPAAASGAWVSKTSTTRGTDTQFSTAISTNNATSLQIPTPKIWVFILFFCIFISMNDSYLWWCCALHFNLASLLSGYCILAWSAPNCCVTVVGGEPDNTYLYNEIEQREVGEKQEMKIRKYMFKAFYKHDIKYLDSLSLTNFFGILHPKNSYREIDVNLTVAIIVWFYNCFVLLSVWSGEYCEYTICTLVNILLLLL